jgi:hypothetical protein
MYASSAIAEAPCFTCGSLSDVEEVETGPHSSLCLCARCIRGHRDDTQSARFWRRVRSSRSRNAERAARAAKARKAAELAADRAEDDAYTAGVLALFAETDRAAAMVASMFGPPSRPPVRPVAYAAAAD